MVTKKPSLADFAKQFERIQCFACVLPEREEIEAAYKIGIARKTICRWLWEVQGYTDKSGVDDTGKVTGISATMVDKHFTGSHQYKKDES